MTVRTTLVPMPHELGGIFGQSETSIDHCIHEQVLGENREIIVSGTRTVHRKGNYWEVKTVAFFLPCCPSAQPRCSVAEKKPKSGRQKECSKNKHHQVLC
jgi:hypothetical protein